ncbi:hypothetical protein [Aquimarina mytili]|uniref:Uncharacterized protein n=1 Tax=Aquimarina mytili TaxID=874423 RepID=A0A937A094_9FLAO|nr:hypothetical protein [Aquimarina mytili]MBL0682099.1 hypothetical protein [Aquimarina mytili]
MKFQKIGVLVVVAYILVLLYACSSDINEGLPEAAEVMTTKPTRPSISEMTFTTTVDSNNPNAHEDASLGNTSGDLDQ